MRAGREALNVLPQFLGFPQTDNAGAMQDLGRRKLATDGLGSFPLYGFGYCNILNLTSNPFFVAV
jgi:hypothetical protein